MPSLPRPRTARAAAVVGAVSLVLLAGCGDGETQQEGQAATVTKQPPVMTVSDGAGIPTLAPSTAGGPADPGAPGSGADGTSSEGVTPGTATPGTESTSSETPGAETTGAEGTTSADDTRTSTEGAPTSTPGAPGTDAPAGSTGALQGRIESYLATRTKGPTRVSVTVHDNKTGADLHINPGTSYETASIVKASVLTAVLDRHTDAGEPGLKTGEKTLARQMITISDNGSTLALYKGIGRGAGVTPLYQALGMKDTVPNSAFGLTKTTADDQVRLMSALAYGHDSLTEQDRETVLDLMHQVNPDQRWGVGTAPDREGGTVQVKNGWLPYGGGWIINSIGHVTGPGRDYTIAMLSNHNPSQAYGMETLSEVGEMVWSGLGGAAQPTS